MPNQTNLKKRNLFFKFLAIILRIIAVFLIGVLFISVFMTEWFNKTFGVAIEQIIYTITSPMKGADTNFLQLALPYIIPAIVLWIVTAILFLLSEKVVSNLKRIHIIIVRVFELLLLMSLCLQTYNYVDKSIGITNFITHRLDKTTIYEDYYVSPLDVEINANNPKNIIYIYMESMETTYASTEEGGHQDENYIQNLTNIANENINFSNTDGLGGWHTTIGTGWTMGALFATQSGIPFSFPIGVNSMGTKQEFAPGVIAMGDILEECGYHNEFVCGSDATFAGRSDFFSLHGNYDILDYYWAQSKGYFEQGRYVWWGYEDLYLYQIAKDRLTELSKNDEPFNFVMLTVDTHHVGGYVCPYCNQTYLELLLSFFQLHLFLVNPL